MNKTGIDLLARRFHEIYQNNQTAWKLAVELGENYIGSIEERSDTIEGTLI